MYPAQGEQTPYRGAVRYSSTGISKIFLKHPKIPIPPTKSPGPCLGRVTRAQRASAIGWQEEGVTPYGESIKGALTHYRKGTISLQKIQQATRTLPHTDG